MTAPAQKPLKVFCSYSRRDEEYVNDLRDSLRGLEHQGLIEWWHDREIVPGWEWEEDIDKHLRTADVILLLVSRAFMASNYVYEKEIRVAVERHERGEARVIPIIIRPADWQWASFGKLQALPKDAKPITRWPDPDDAWLDVVQGVRRAVGKLLRERHEQEERYRKVLGQAWTDGRLSEVEAEQLSALASELSLSADTFAEIERGVMGDTKEAILERQEQAAREKERKERLDSLYAEARRLHRDQQWQAVIDTFAQIHAEVPDYPDPAEVRASAREALEAEERARRVAVTYDQGQRHMKAEEWQQALESFEEVQRLEPSYQETERLLSQVQRELAELAEPAITASNAYEIRVLRTFHASEVTRYVTFSPDGRLLASAGGTTVRLWQVDDGSLVRRLFVGTQSVAYFPDWQLLAFSPDWRLLASAAGTTVQLRQGDEGALLRNLRVKGSQYDVTSVTFSPDGQLLATGLASNYGYQGSMGFARLWRVEDGVRLQTLKSEGAVISVAFSPDGQLLATGSTDTTAHLWQVDDGSFVRTLRHENNAAQVRSAAFSPDGQLLALGDGVVVRLWGHHR